MSISHVSHIRNAALAVFAFGTVAVAASAATADPELAVASARASQQKQATATCNPISRPKHTINRCGCTPNAVASISSVDTAEIIRLLTGGDHACRGATPPSR